MTMNTRQRRQTLTLLAVFIVAALWGLGVCFAALYIFFHFVRKYW
jgi:hypothetical protein